MPNFFLVLFKASTRLNKQKKKQINQCRQKKNLKIYERKQITIPLHKLFGLTELRINKELSNTMNALDHSFT
jgi:hypothetical protein